MWSRKVKRILRGLVFTELVFQRRDMTGGIVVANCALSASTIYRIRILRLHFCREGRRYTPTFRDRGQRFLGTLRGVPSPQAVRCPPRGKRHSVVSSEHLLNAPRGPRSKTSKQIYRRSEEPRRPQ